MNPTTPENPTIIKAPPKIDFSHLPQVKPDDTLGEIQERIGRNIAREQDTLMHRFCAENPDIKMEDVSLCHGMFKTEHGGMEFRMWVHVLTPDEKEVRTQNRKDDAELKALREHVDGLVTAITKAKALIPDSGAFVTIEDARLAAAAAIELSQAWESHQAFTAPSGS